MCVEFRIDESSGQIWVIFILALPCTTSLHSKKDSDTQPEKVQSAISPWRKGDMVLSVYIKLTETQTYWSYVRFLQLVDNHVTVSLCSCTQPHQTDLHYKGKKALKASLCTHWEIGNWEVNEYWRQKQVEEERYNSVRKKVEDTQTKAKPTHIQCPQLLAPCNMPLLFWPTGMNNTEL